MSGSHYARNCYSSDSDDEEEWSNLQKKSKKRKPAHSKRHKADMSMDATNLEEGEISSELEDDEDDGLDENLVGGEEDKRRLAKMSEKEREEELFKRAERRDAIQARRAVKLKLKEKRDRERAEQASKSTVIDTSMNKKSTYSNVFTSDSEDGINSDSDAAGPQGLRRRKLALEKRKEANSSKFDELIKRRLRQAAKKRRTQSGSDEDQEQTSGHNSIVRSSAASSFSDTDMDDKSKKDKTRSPHMKPMSKRVYSDHSESSDSSRRGARQRTRRPSLSSLSGSQRSASSSGDDARGRSRSPEEELVSSFEQLSRIRLSRFKIEKWVHMPFFDDLVKGCFVRINIGLNQGVAVYRCAEIMNMVEIPKIYDLGDTRTNKGMVVRIGKDQSTLRLAIVSNSEFVSEEFESWKRRILDANIKPPTMTFVNRKAAEIQDAITRPIRDESVVEQIIQSKRRFQRAPTNFAMHKAELMKQREQAEVEADVDTLHRLDMELEETESQAERIDRRRTLGFKSITSINQRNRALSVQQAEEAIRQETEEAKLSKEVDPFTRVHSQPVIVTKKYLKQLRSKRESLANLTAAGATDTSTTEDAGVPHSISASVLQTPNASRLPGTPGNGSLLLSTPNASGRVKWSIADDTLEISTPHDSLHAIHNFEININLDLDGGGGDQKSCMTNTDGQPTSHHQHITSTPAPRSVSRLSTDSLNDITSSLPGTPNGVVSAKPSRRLLNLQEYKKRYGLI